MAIWRMQKIQKIRSYDSGGTRNGIRYKGCGCFWFCPAGVQVAVFSVIVFSLLTYPLLSIFHITHTTFYFHWQLLGNSEPPFLPSPFYSELRVATYRWYLFWYSDALLRCKCIALSPVAPYMYIYVCTYTHISEANRRHNRNSRAARNPNHVKTPVTLN